MVCEEIADGERLLGGMERSFPMAAMTNHHKPAGFETAEMYSFVDLEARSLKSRRHQDCAPSGGSGGRILPASSISWRLQMSLGLWLHHSNLCLCLHMAFSSVSVSLSLLSLIRTFVTGFRMISS